MPLSEQQRDWIKAFRADWEGRKLAVNMPQVILEIIDTLDSDEKCAKEKLRQLTEELNNTKKEGKQDGT